MSKRAIRILLPLALAVSACGGGVDTTDAPEGGSAAPVSGETSGPPATEAGDSAPGDSSAGAGTAVVTFEEDGSTLEFVLDECTTSNTAPGNFVNVGPEGAFTSHGVLDDGWELQLSMIPDATGSITNLSFLTDGDETDYQLGDLTYEVDGGDVTASATSDIYQTLSEEEAIPLSFEVSCNT